MHTRHINMRVDVKCFMKFRQKDSIIFVNSMGIGTCGSCSYLCFPAHVRCGSPSECTVPCPFINGKWNCMTGECVCYEWGDTQVVG